MNKRPVIVVGGGIGGLAAALALANNGVPVHVLERASDFAEIGAGIQVGPNGYKMLKRLNLEAEVSRLAVFPERLTMMDSLSGDVVTSIPTGDAFVKRFGYPYTLVHRADIHSVLQHALREHKDIVLETSSEFASYEDHGTHVRVTLANGRVIEGSALIGADGLWSKVRQSIIADGAPRVSGHIAYRTVLPIADIPEAYRHQAMTLWAGPKNHLVHYPLRGGEQFNLVAVVHSDRYVEGWNTKGDPDELLLRFAGCCKPVQDLLSKVNAWRMWVLCDREPRSDWSRGLATLLGDAAHPMLQYMAQGACMAIEDAIALADCVKESGVTPEALARYAESRYLRTGRVQLTARFYGEWFHASGVARELRKMMLKDRTPEDAYAGLAWLYDY